MPSGSFAEPRRSQNPFYKLVRTLSGDPGNPTSDTQTPVTLTATSSPNSKPKADAGEVDYQQAPTSPLKDMKRRLSFSKHLKSFGREDSKLGDNSGKAHDVPVSSNKGLPPPGANALSSSSSQTETADSLPPGAHNKDLSMVTEDPDTRAPFTATAPSPEPAAVASRIQTIIDSMPPPPASPEPIRKPPKPPARDANGRPIPPPGTTPIKDPKFIGVLSNPSIMNGSEEKGRMSVWSVLESFEAPRQDVPSDEGNRDGGEIDPGPDVPVNPSSVMIYFPLIPTKDDFVELAELVPLILQEGVQPDTGEHQPAFGWVTTMWPLSTWYPPAKEESTNPINILKQAWIPSSTKLSLQAMWWGYRMYLPPPVMGSLDNQQLEATKRAALITTALTWFFNNIPMDSVPIPLRPTLLLLQRLVPIIGYIGTFISWSWGTIKSYDKGFGVILTATWVLPVALIPSTWQEANFPKSLSPTPLAQIDKSSPLLVSPRSTIVSNAEDNLISQAKSGGDGKGLASPKKVKKMMAMFSSKSSK